MKARIRGKNQAMLICLDVDGLLETGAEPRRHTPVFCGCTFLRQQSRVTHTMVARPWVSCPSGPQT